MLRFRVNGKCWAITGGRQEPEIDLEYSQRFVGIFEDNAGISFEFLQPGDL